MRYPQSFQLDTETGEFSLKCSPDQLAWMWMSPNGKALEFDQIREGYVVLLPRLS